GEEVVHARETASHIREHGSLVAPSGLGIPLFLAVAFWGRIPGTVTGAQARTSPRNCPEDAGVLMKRAWGSRTFATRTGLLGTHSPAGPTTPDTGSDRAP